LIGTARRMLGDEEGGRIELDAARAGFARLGAAADVRHASTLLQRPHAAPRVLTDREVEVLRLVASGNSNRDIAARLQISEHTVARHPAEHSHQAGRVLPGRGHLPGPYQGAPLTGR
jgi:DNA-binding CsgD family transcriptional regulator